MTVDFKLNLISILSSIIDFIFELSNRNKFELSKQIQLADMDARKKKKSGKNEFAHAIKGNEEIRAISYHTMTFEQLEEN